MEKTNLNQSKKVANIKNVKDFQIYLDEFLGKGQFGIVCKARYASDYKKPNAQVYACKIMRAANISNSDQLSIDKEIKIQRMI